MKESATSTYLILKLLYRDLSMQLASSLLSQTPAEEVVSACPFYIFNLGYASRKNGLGKRVTYFTSLVAESLR